jgi:hypothetical protein
MPLDESTVPLMAGGKFHMLMPIAAWSYCEVSRASIVHVRWASCLACHVETHHDET